MMRKFTNCLMVCAAMFLASSCNDDVSSPPKSGFTVDKTEGLAGETEFTFTVDEAPGAGTVSVLPYGIANPSLGGVSVSSFTNGKATVKFTYAQVGTFDAVVVTNNHSSDGKSVKNTYSSTVTITIKSEKNQITEFVFDKISTDTKIDQDAHTIVVKVPFGTDVTKLTPKITNDAFSTVAEGGTAGNFSSPKSFTVTSNNGVTNTYTVTVLVTARNDDFSLKSFTGKETSKAVNGVILNSAIADNGTDIILYDVLGSPTTNWDSVELNYALNNEFAALHLGTDKNKFKSGTTVNLTSTKQVTILAQDSATTQHVYTLHALAAPLLNLEAPSTDANSLVGVNTNFNILVKALKTKVTNSTVTLNFRTTNTASAHVNSITLFDKTNPTGIDVPVIPVTGKDQSVNFNDNVSIVLNVTDGSLTYDVTYTAGLTELK